MIGRAFAILILASFGLSLLLFPLLEAGHEMLHHFKNEIHHHDVGSNHTLTDHHLEPHHHDADDDDQDDMDKDADVNNLLSLLFGFFDQSKKDETIIPSILNQKYAELISVYNSINPSPPTPPPPGMALSRSF